MSIFSVIYEGYNVEHNQYGKCLLLVREELCTTAYCYEQSLEFEFSICSDLDIQYITEDFCAGRSAELLDSFYIARDTGSAFICFVDPLQSKRNFYNIPRFAEVDFEQLIKKIGGRKISETTTKTPDFFLDGIVIELKDIQKDGLFDKDRQKAIVEIFKYLKKNTVNLNPTADHGDLTAKYHAQIRNTIQNQIKTASTQIKTYKETNEVKAAGVILLNTGMFSLPDQLFRSMVTHILKHQTKTVEFAFVFSQVNQSNGYDTVANFYGDFIGKVPDTIKPLKVEVSNLTEKKMTEAIFSVKRKTSSYSQYPISFFGNDKVFYWNPGRLPDSRRNSL